MSASWFIVHLHSFSITSKTYDAAISVDNACVGWCDTQPFRAICGHFARCAVMRCMCIRTIHLAYSGLKHSSRKRKESCALPEGKLIAVWADFPAG